MRTAFCQNQLLKITILIVTSLIIFRVASAQLSPDSVLQKINPKNWIGSVDKKVSKLEQKIIAKSQKTLDRLQRQEEKLYRKMRNGKDSLRAKAALADSKEKYKSLRDKLKDPLHKGGNTYISKLDTLTTTLKFLERQGSTAKVKDALAKTQSLQDKFQQAEEIKKFIRERKQQLENVAITKQLKRFNKEAYYYDEQIKEYKELLKDSRKAERKAIELLSKTKLFKDFMQKNSQLASLFRLPGNTNDPMNAASLAGLQTRAQVNNLIQQQISSGGPNAQQQFRQNLQDAQSRLNQLKNKIISSGNGNSDDMMPEGFKPNRQRTKSFLQRLEYGTNIQTQKATNFFPVTSDIGLSVGYKLNDKSVIGVGASYKMGWGNGWRDLTISSQGVGLRAFADLKLKGSFWATGGYERNYKTAFNSIAELQAHNAWQQSGLIGVSKVVALKTKFFKKTKLQLLWDFLSYGQVPKAQPIMFRVGYTF